MSWPGLSFFFVNLSVSIKMPRGVYENSGACMQNYITFNRIIHSGLHPEQEVVME